MDNITCNMNRTFNKTKGVLQRKTLNVKCIHKTQRKLCHIRQCYGKFESGFPVWLPLYGEMTVEWNHLEYIYCVWVGCYWCCWVWFSGHLPHFGIYCHSRTVWGRRLLMNSCYAMPTNFQGNFLSVNDRFASYQANET